MPNPEHLTLLLTPEWNAWSSRNSNVAADLTDAAFAGKALSGKNLKRADLSRPNLPGAPLAATDSPRATLDQTRLTGASAPGAILEHCKLDQLNLSKIFFAG